MVSGVDQKGDQWWPLRKKARSEMVQCSPREKRAPCDMASMYLSLPTSGGKKNVVFLRKYFQYICKIIATRVTL